MPVLRHHSNRWSPHFGKTPTWSCLHPSSQGIVFPAIPRRFSYFYTGVDSWSRDESSTAFTEPSPCACLVASRTCRLGPAPQWSGAEECR